MSKRYYLSDIVGDGLTPETAYRSKIADYVTNYIALIPTDLNGTPTVSYTIAKVAALDHLPLQNIPGIAPLPDFPLDAKVNAMQTAAKNKMIADMNSHGIDTGLINNADGYRDIIRYIGKGIDPNFDENNFDVSDV